MKKAYNYILSILENKKLNMFLWLLILIYLLWGFRHPDEFTIHKWGTLKPGEQYFILIVMLGITIAKLIHTYLAIKKEKQGK